MSRDPITEHEAWTILADGKGHQVTRRGTVVWIDDHPVTPIPNRLPTCRPPVGAVFRSERSVRATICERCGETDPVMMNERLCDACESHQTQWKKQPPVI